MWVHDPPSHHLYPQVASTHWGNLCSALRLCAEPKTRFLKKKKMDKKSFYSHFNFSVCSLNLQGLQSCQQPPIISQVHTHTHTHTRQTQAAVKIKQQQLLTDKRCRLWTPCQGKSSWDEFTPSRVSTAYLLRLPARSVCCGVTKRPIIASNAGISSGVSGALRCHSVPNVPVSHPFITGRLPERCLCCSRLILPSGRGSGALTSLYQSSRKLSTTHGRGMDTNPLEAHTHTHTHIHRVYLV